MTGPAAATSKTAPDTATVVRDNRSPPGRRYALTILFCAAESAAEGEGPAPTTKSRPALT
jgi:hypothetical protein